MYFITTILSFLTLTMVLFGLSIQTENLELHNALLLFGAVTSIITTITIFCMIFQNMNFRNNIKYYINNIRKAIRNKAVAIKNLETYKTEFKEFITKMYPEYEKTIFNSMAKNDANQLEMLMVKYPELKFDGILIKYIDGVNTRLSNVANYDYNINDTINNIEDVISNGWMLGTVTLPEDIINLKKNK